MDTTTELKIQLQLLQRKHQQIKIPYKPLDGCITKDGVKLMQKHGGKCPSWLMDIIKINKYLLEMKEKKQNR